MKIFIVQHEHWTEDTSQCFYEIISANLSREKAEKSLSDAKRDCLSKYWSDYDPDDEYSSVEVGNDLEGLFEIHDNMGCDSDELLIVEQEIKD